MKIYKHLTLDARYRIYAFKKSGQSARSRPNIHGYSGSHDTKTKVKSPQTNGIRERFHRTIVNEFCQIAFRKRVYQTLEERQADAWMQHCNGKRPHSGRYCYGKTSMETFAESKHPAASAF